MLLFSLFLVKKRDANQKESPQRRDESRAADMLETGMKFFFFF
jgi:hypothetical protein